MATILVTLGALLLAVVVAPRVPVGLRALVVVAILAVPVLWTLPRTLRRESDRIDRYFGLTPVEAEVASPINWPQYTNVPLLLGIRRHVPRDATISFFPGGKWAAGRTPEEARRTYLQTGWVRWVAFASAPRLVEDDDGAPWAVLVDQSPAQAGIHPAAAWQFGRDWLVRR